MYNNIGDKIKGMAVLIAVASIGIGIFLFLLSINQYFEYRDYLDTTVWKMGMIYSIVLIVTGIISSFLIYGFGQIIIHLRNMDYKINGYVEDDNREPFKATEELAELDEKNNTSNME